MLLGAAGVLDMFLEAAGGVVVECRQFSFRFFALCYVFVESALLVMFSSHLAWRCKKSKSV